MQWDKEAVEEFVKMPLADVMKETGKVFSEKLARKNNSDRVTLREIDCYEEGLLRPGS